MELVVERATRGRAGYVCGGEPFGYRNRQVLGPDGRRSHVEREVHEPEAVVVRRIFSLYAAGKGLKGITKLLNEEGVPSPRPKLNRPRAWAPSSVGVVLRNKAYRGVSVWNKRRQTDRWRQRACRIRPEAEWIRTDVPQWRIVSDEEWDAAHRRLLAAAAIYMRSTDGKLWGRPPSGVESKYLLSALMQCQCCGASMTVRSSSHGRQFYYVCASYDHRGRAVCPNALRLPMPTADDAILTKVSDYVLDREVVEGAIADAVRELRPSRDSVEARHGALTEEIRKLESEQARYVAAIAIAGQVEALAQALGENDKRRARLRHELEALDSPDHLSTFDVRQVERDLRKRLVEWRGLLRRQTPLARQVLGRLLDGRISWTPRKDQGVYEFVGRARFDRLLSGIVFTRGVVPVRGFAPYGIHYSS